MAQFVTPAPGRLSRSPLWLAGPRVALMFCALLACLAILLPASAVGQTTLPIEEAVPAEPDPAMEAAEIDDMIAVLEDDAARQQLIDQLRLMREALEPEDESFEAGRGFLNFVSERMSHIGDRISEIGHAVRGFPEILVWIEAMLGSSILLMRWLDLTLGIALVLAIGYAVRVAVARLVVRHRDEIGARPPRPARVARIPLALVRLAIDLAPLVGFVLGATVAIVLLNQPPGAEGVSITFVTAVWVAGIVTALLRFVLAPRSPNVRLVRLQDAVAKSLFNRIRVIAGVVIWGIAVSEFMLAVGATLPAAQGLRSLAGIIAGVLMVVLILRMRVPVSQGFRRMSARSQWLGVFWRRLAYSWHVLAILYIVLIFGVWVLRVPDGFLFMVRGTVLALVLLVAARLAMVAIERLLDRFERRRQEQAEATGIERKPAAYLPALKRTVQAVLGVIVLVLLLEVWGLGILAWFDTDLGRRALGNLSAIVIVVLVSIAVWEIVTALIERHFKATDEAGNLIERSARERTLLPLLRNFILIVLLLIVVMIVMSQIGINIGPLLAGAGVVGLAVGFGAQTLVKDIITGLFILFEDQIQVGDVIQVAGHSGLVEGMTIRTLRLRDLEGVVHILPFSQVDTVMNKTKEFSYYVMDIGVAYRENTDEVVQVINRLSAELRADPEIGPLMLDDIEVLGVDAFADSAVIIKARIKTLPIKQWQVGREFNRRMKLRFDELGIEIPFPHRTLYFGVDKHGKAPAAPIRVDSAPSQPRNTKQKPKRKPPRKRPADPDSPETGPMADD